MRDRGCVFFSDRQAVDASPGTGRRYDEIASGFAIYAYVGNDPLNLTDPLGLCDNPQGCGGGFSNYFSGSLSALGQIPRDIGNLLSNPSRIPAALAGALPGIAPAASELPQVVSGTIGAARALVNVSPTPGPAPDFVVSPNGTVYPVPEGAQGPVPVINPGGNQTGVAFMGGSGGVNGQVSTMRLMNPTPPRGNSPGYPNGYIVYQNNASPTPQLVDPITGQTTSRALGHFPVQ